jgi:hypothetical protein
LFCLRLARADRPGAENAWPCRPRVKRRNLRDTTLALKIADEADGTRAVPATLDAHQVPLGAGARGQPRKESVESGLGGRSFRKACRNYGMGNRPNSHSPMAIVIAKRDENRAPKFPPSATSADHYSSSRRATLRRPVKLQNVASTMGIGRGIHRNARSSLMT